MISPYYYYSRPRRSKVVQNLNGETYLALEKAIDTSYRTDDTFHTIAPEDRIDLLADVYLGDAKFWWVIADYNAIDDARFLDVGRTIRIPSLPNLYAHVLE